MSLNKNIKTAHLLNAIEITPISLFLIKRKIQFIQQLLNNEASWELILDGIHRSIQDLSDFIGPTNEQISFILINLYFGKFRYFNGLVDPENQKYITKQGTLIILEFKLLFLISRFNLSLLILIYCKNTPKK